jgi:Ni/Fe-hydrogenase subunit HybB-like protein
MPYLSNSPTTLYTSYVPSFIEIVVGAGVIAFGMMSITLGVKYLGIVDHGVEVATFREKVEKEASLALGD